MLLQLKDEVISLSPEQVQLSGLLTEIHQTDRPVQLGSEIPDGILRQVVWFLQNAQSKTIFEPLAQIARAAMQRDGMRTVSGFMEPPERAVFGSWIDSRSLDEVMDLCKAAAYLDIVPLCDLASCALAVHISKMRPEEMRAKFQIEPQYANNSMQRFDALMNASAQCKHE